MVTVKFEGQEIRYNDTMQASRAMQMSADFYGRDLTYTLDVCG